MRRILSLLVSGIAMSCSLSGMESSREDVSDAWSFRRVEHEEAPGLPGALAAWVALTGNPLRTVPLAPPPGNPPAAAGTPADPDFDDQGWRTLDLPHDWGIEGPFSPALPGETARLPWHGVGWYRKTFTLATLPVAGERVQFEVEGAMSHASVWCNGQLVGGWAYGYSSWRVELTPALRAGANVLAIRLDNPPDSSRWYPGGGIYRRVWLLRTPAIAVAPWGVNLATVSLHEDRAEVQVSTRLEHAGAIPQGLTVDHELVALDEAGRPDETTRITTPAQAWDLAAKNGTTAITVPQPRLWSVAHPHRYQLTTRIRHGEAILDRVVTIVGIRTARFAADGFFLNGLRVPLHGVCLHHDLGALGAAFNRRAAERQLALLRQVGCNAIRTSHNPPAPEFLDLCDRMGFLVMDEFSDTWTIAKKPNGYATDFAWWSEPDVRAMVRRDRHHPSVVLWSIGNEIGEQRHPDGPAIARRLTDLVREEDPSRQVGVGCDQIEAGYNGFQQSVDVFGYNYKPHQYAAFRTANPDQPLIGSETASCVSSRGVYAFPVSDDPSEGRIGTQVSSYDLAAPGWASPPDTEFRGQDANPWVAGEFVWTGFDYLGEPTPFNQDPTILTNFHTPEERAKAEQDLARLGSEQHLARSSYFGIFDTAGFPKDRFYLYQSRWRPELPMAHLLPHWSWPGREGQVTPVHLYTSGDAAELFLNGRSLGRKAKQPGDYRLRWDDVRYEPGRLSVIAYRQGQRWAEDAVETVGPARALEVTADRPAIHADGKDLAFLTVRIVDAQGRTVPDAQVPFSVRVEGTGTVVATDNGDPTDLTAFSSPQRRTMSGLGLAIIRRTGSAPVTVHVTAPGLQAAWASVALRQ